MSLAAAVDSAARETGFAGVVRIDVGAAVQFEAAYGLADRRHQVPMTTRTRLGIASGTKLLTACAVMALIDGGVLNLATTARSVLGVDLPLVGNDVTVEHLLAHRSGIGDYVDEDSELDVDDYELAVPVQHLTTTEDYVAALDGVPPKFSPGTAFSYSNSGYVVLALIAERAAGTPFTELVDKLVCTPAGMVDTSFPLADELGALDATGYRAESGLATNVYRLPLRGSGDGGAYSTVADVAALWRSLLGGKLLPTDVVEQMLRPVSVHPSSPRRYGLGVWIDADRDDVFLIEGCDAGVSFWSAHDAGAERTVTVISNTTDGAWPIARLCRQHAVDGEADRQ